MRLTRKAVIATSAAVLAAGVTPALLPGGGDAYARGGPACLEKFHVHATEDLTWEGDEPYLKVVTDFWHAPASMDNPSTAAVNVTVHYGDVVKAYDDDGDDGEDADDDLIGRATVTRDERRLEFKGDDAFYSAEYSPGRCPGT
jgi:hypothetical protein